MNKELLELLGSINQCSDFNSMNLRFVANKLPHSHEISLANAERIKSIDLPGPVWTECSERYLSKLGDSWSNSVLVAIRKGSLPFTHSPVWGDQYEQALSCTFNLTKQMHLFRSTPTAAWTNFTEPQLTGGFEHFLNTQNAQARRERVSAFLKAIGRPEFAKHLQQIDATAIKTSAEVPTSHNKRLDLLITWKIKVKMGDEEQYAVVIEAKFNHKITAGQLPAYKQHVSRIVREEGRRTLVVLAPKRKANQLQYPMSRNKEWRLIFWRDFLISYERSLLGCYDSSDFCSFRRQVWDQLN